MAKRKITIDKIINLNVIRIFMYIIIFSIVSCLLMNTWYLVTEPFLTGDHIRANTLDKHTRELLTNSTYVDLGYSNIKNADYTINTIGSSETITYTLIEIVSTELQLVFLLLAVIEVLNFISKKNIEKPFTNDNIKIINKIIKYLLITIMVPIIFYIIECIFIPSFIETIGEIFPYIYEVISLENALYIMILIIIKNIIIKGKEIKQTSSK